MLKIVSWGVKQDKKHAVAVWKTERYFEVKPKDKKQDWEADRHMNFLRNCQVFILTEDTEDGLISLSTFQYCFPFWLYSENTTLLLGKFS